MAALLASYGVAVAGFDQDVGGRGGLARGDLPDVQAVDLDDVGLGGESDAEGVGGDAGRGGFQEDAVGAAQDLLGDFRRWSAPGPETPREVGW
ncbi:hypothetical protein [Streptomyces sp. NBC_00046]|uniref:hypothetical protein n=1 Tax=unclassified Streptomyces TaxID=2593676 RepID=UPI003870A8E0